MQIFHPAALVSSAELSPDQQTRHILRQQSPKGRSLVLPCASAFISILPSFAFKKSSQLWALLHLAPIYHHHHPSPPPPPLPRMGRCCCPCAYSERNGLLSLLLPVTEGHAGLPPPNKASAIVIICIDA